MADTHVTQTRGMSVFGWLTLVFVILKLNPGGHLDSQVQDWSWWLVFSPLLVGLGIILFFLLAVGVALGGAALLDWRDERRRKARLAARIKEQDERRRNSIAPPPPRKYI